MNLQIRDCQQRLEENHAVSLVSPIPSAHFRAELCCAADLGLFAPFPLILFSCPLN